MYTVDQLDNVVKLADAPSPERGAPLPVVVATDYELAIEYYVSPQHAQRGAVQNNEVADQFAYIWFKLPYAHMFGPPNDEAFEGHPLAGRGLSPYGVFEVRQSSWIRQLETMNSVHPYHKPEHFEKYRHFVFVFHDSTFECVAVGFDFVLGEQARLSGPPKLASGGGAP